MGLLKRLDGGQEYALEAHNLIGRGPHCSLVVTSKYVSSEHLSLDWIDNQWLARDLGTTNGTYIDNEPVKPGIPKICREGQRLALGVFGECWELADASPPKPMVVSVGSNDREVHEILHGAIVLPKPENPEVSIYEDSEGRWMLEQHGNTDPIVPNQTFLACETMWRLSAPDTWQYTVRNEKHLCVEHARTTFYVSSDEETVEMCVDTTSELIWMPDRSHNYLLLTLARKRLSDRESKGWVDRKILERMLKVDESSLNVWIYRARRSFSDYGFQRPAAIIERQNGALRIGFADVAVKKLEEKGRI